MEINQRVFWAGVKGIRFGLRIQYIDIYLLGIKEVMLTLRGSVPISGRPGIKSSPAAIKKLTKSIAVELVMY